MKTVNVTNKAELKRFESISALTIEGLSTSEDNLKDYEEWMKGYGVDTTNLTFHIVMGSLMNSSYKLTGDNAYPDDCSIVVATGIDTTKLTLPRFQVGGRWFDDIVDNNARREKEKKK